MSLRHLFREKLKPSLISYISPFINLFKNTSMQPPMKEVLTKELELRSGMETEYENPDKLLNNKSKDVRFYDTLLADDKIKSCIDLKKRFALSARGDIISASEEKEDMEKADFIRWQFDNTTINFYDLIDNYADAMAYGYKVGEIVWANEERMNKLGKNVPKEFMGRWFIEKIKHKHSVFFDFGYNDYGDIEKLLIGRQYGFDTEILGEELYNKFLIFTYPYPKDGSYYGQSDLMEVYPQWYAKFNIFRFRNQYLEKYGMPIPKTIYNAQTTSSSEKDELKAQMKNWQDSMYFLIPGAYNPDAKKLIGKFDIELLETRKGEATDQYEKAIDQIDKQIARKLLIPDKLGFSETSTGSYSLGEVHMDIFVAVIEDLQQKLEALINKLIVRIIEFNYPVNKSYPTWQFNKLSHHIKAEMLKILIEKGVVDKREKWIRKYVSIPELDEKEKEEIEEAKKEDIKNNPIIQNQFPNQQQPQNNNQNNKPQEKQKQFKIKIHPLDFKAVKNHYDEAEIEFIRDYESIWMENIKYLIKQVENKGLIDPTKVKEVELLQIKKTDLKKLFQNYFTRLYIDGRIDAIDEIKGRIKKTGFKKNELIEMQLEEYADMAWVKSLLEKYEELGKLTEWDGEGFKLIKARAYINAGDTELQMLDTVGNVIYDGLRNNKTMSDVVRNISKLLTDDLQKYKLTVARTGASDFYNTGRMNLFKSRDINPYIVAYQYIAILDDATTEFCRGHDEQIIQKDDPQVSTINPPNHYNCRSILSPIFLGENSDIDSYYYDWEETGTKWGTGVPVDYRVPSKGFGG